MSENVIQDSHVSIFFFLYSFVKVHGMFRSIPPTFCMQVTDLAKSATASTRCIELARSKPLAEGFQHAREIEWPVSKAAKRAQASGRLIELARPITRASMDHLQFNPDAFAVKESALKGAVPRRVEELAQPINR